MPPTNTTVAKIPPVNRSRPFAAGESGPNSLLMALFRVAVGFMSSIGPASAWVRESRWRGVLAGCAYRSRAGFAWKGSQPRCVRFFFHAAPSCLPAMSACLMRAGAASRVFVAVDPGLTGHVSRFWMSRSRLASGSSRAPIRSPEASSVGGSTRGQPTVVCGMPAFRHSL